MSDSSEESTFQVLDSILGVSPSVIIDQFDILPADQRLELVKMVGDSDAFDVAFIETEDGPMLALKAVSRSPLGSAMVATGTHDRSAAGRTAANARWAGHQELKINPGERATVDSVSSVTGNPIPAGGKEILIPGGTSGISGSVVDFKTTDPAQTTARAAAKADPTFHGGTTPTNPDGYDTQHMFGVFNADGTRSTRVLENGETVGLYNDSRTALHQQIVDKMFEGVTPVANPVCEFTGGGPASGKGSLDDELSAKLGPNHVHVDADEIKKMLPEVHAMAIAGDKSWAGYSHEESSDICKMVLDEAARRGVNVLYDGTGNSDYPKLARKVESFRSKGFKVNATYITVPTEIAVKAAIRRGKKPLFEGAKVGRVVPPSIVRETHKNVSAIVPEILRNKLFDSVQVRSNYSVDGKNTMMFDNQVLLASGNRNGSTVHSKTGYQQFLDKATTQSPIEYTNMSGTHSKIVFSKAMAKIMRKARK
jgi:predicted ABC-type ATPase